MKINNFTQYNENKMSSLKEPSDKEVQDAEIYLKEGKDPSWDLSKFGYFYIDTSGKYSVYYTLWRFKPGVKTVYNFITNLSTDFNTAVEKAKIATGRVPVMIDRTGTNAGMFKSAKAELMSFGKYRGKTLGDIFVEDPQYIIWLTKNYDGKSPERAERLKYYNDLYFDTIKKKNLEESKSQFIGKIGDKIEIEAEIYNVEKIEGIDEFQCRCKLIDKEGNKYMTYNIGTNKEVKKGDNVKLAAKVSGHKEFLGVKFTTINYCKIIWNQREDIQKYNL